jgi:hypothetical protein
MHATPAAALTGRPDRCPTRPARQTRVLETTPRSNPLVALQYDQTKGSHRLTLAGPPFIRTQTQLPKLLGI